MIAKKLIMLVVHGLGHIPGYICTQLRPNKLNMARAETAGRPDSVLLPFFHS